MMPKEVSSWLPAYDGDDMASELLKNGFQLGGFGRIKSITNVRDTAVIVTNMSVFRARPHAGMGYCVELVAHLI